MGGYDWTISHNSGTSSYAFRVDIAGSVAYDYVDDYGSAVRPSFYLNSVVQYSSGIGTESDPIRLVVDSSDSTTKRTNHSNSSNNSRPRT